jgi:peptide deformylase
MKIWPDPILNKKAEPVVRFSPILAEVISAMLDATKKAHAVGLAAPQVGISKRILVYSILGEDGHMINPEVTWKSDEYQETQEGCLSFPGIYITAKRYKEVKVRYFTLDGEQKEMHAKGYHAVVIQHELDHLDGLVFTRFLSKLKRDTVKSKMTKLKRKLKRRNKVAKQFATRDVLEDVKEDKKRAAEQRQELETAPVDTPAGSDSGYYDFSLDGE